MDGCCVDKPPCLPSVATRNGHSVATSGMGGEDSKRRERSTGTGEPGLTAAVPDFGSFLRQVFPEQQGELERQVSPEARGAEDGVVGGQTTRGLGASLRRRDYETAFTLLQRASDAFPVLLRHSQQLEAEISHVKADLQADLESARGETQQWQQIALALKMHIEENEQQIALLRKRLAAAEERLEAGQSLAHEAEQQASLAIGITTLFHDKIIDAFGVGSAAHTALDTLAQGGLNPEPPAGPRLNDL